VTYMEVTAPLSLKETRFLLFERQQGADELFIWVPALNRVVPVREDARKQSFLGSDFYVSDLVTPDLDAFTHAVAGETEVGGRACTLVESIPKDTTDALYGKVVFAIDPTDLLIMRTEFFDPQGKTLKTWSLDEVEKIDGQWTPRVQQMQNVQQGTTSRIELNDVEYGADIDDEVFTRAYLKR
jgi:outer membrane lipoprotein-sorting protein